MARIVTNNNNILTTGSILLSSSGSTTLLVNGLSVLYLSGSSNAGINNTNPNYSLDVSGDINTNTFYRIGGTVVINNSASVTASSIHVNNLSSSGVLYYDGTKLLNDSNNFFYDYTNHKLGIGTSSLNATLHINSNNAGMSNLLLEKTAGQPVFSVTPWTNQIYIGAGAFYSSSAWYTQNSGNAQYQLFSLFPGTGTTWFANGAMTNPITQTITLWTDSGSWVSSINSNNITGSIYGTSSFAISSSHALTSSYALNTLSASYAPGGQATLTSGSTYNITSSWAISASYAPTGISTTAISSSWASASLSASYSPNIFPDITDNTTTHYVGINTSTPHYTLDVSGSINAVKSPVNITVGGSISQSQLPISITGDTGGYFGMWNQGSSYFNFGTFNSAHILLCRYTAGSDGTAIMESLGNASIIAGGYGGGLGNTYIRISDDATNQGVELGDNIGGQLNVCNGNVGIHNGTPIWTLDVNGIIGNSQYSDINTIQLDDGFGIFNITSSNVLHIAAMNGIVFDNSVTIKTYNNPGSAIIGIGGNGVDPTVDVQNANYSDAFSIIPQSSTLSFIGINKSSPAYHLDVSGSINASTNIISPYFIGTSSWSKNAISASYSPSSGASSIASGSSYNITASVSLTSSYLSGSNSITLNLTSSNLLITGSQYQTPLVLSSNLNNFIEIYAQNLNSGTTASTDIAITQDTGNVNVGYIDMGINSSTYAAGFVGNANDAYMFSTSSGQLFVGNASPNKNLYLFAGGYTQTSSVILTSTGKVGIGLTNPFNTLDVIGNISCSAITASNLSSFGVNGNVIISGGAGGTGGGATIVVSGSDGTGNANIVLTPGMGQNVGNLILKTATAAGSYVNIQDSNSVTRISNDSNGNVIISGSTNTVYGNLNVVGTITASLFNGTSSWSNNSISSSIVQITAGTMYYPLLTTKSGSNGIYIDNTDLQYNQATAQLYVTSISSSNITSSGISATSIGIGILTPKNKLDVVGNISCSIITASLFFGTASYSLSSSLTLSSSYSLSSSFARNGIITGSTYPITSSWTITASYVSGSPSIVNYTLLTTSSAQWVTASFANSENYLNITNGQLYNFTCSNLPTPPQVLGTSVFIYNTATATSSLAFPANWIWLGSVPTSITSSKSAVLSLKAYGTASVIAGFAVQY